VGNVAEEAKGHWDGILRELGVDDEILNGKHHGCPMCGGTDRFRFDNKEGRGDYICGQCGAGDGLKLLQGIFDWDFATAAKEVEAVLGVTPEDKPRPKADHTARLKRIQSELVDAGAATPVGEYLKGRGLTGMSKYLKLNPQMRYYHGKDDYTEYPAMVAKVVDNDGKPVAFHVTYIKDGEKAPESSPKKVIGELGENGYAVRLYRPNQHLGVAEGIETAIAAKLFFDTPTWAVLNTNGMKDFRPPEGITKVTIFADNDSNFAGQAAAYALAQKLVILKYRVLVLVPKEPDTDFLDVLVEYNQT